MHGMVLVLWGWGGGGGGSAILGNGYGVQGQNYVVLLQGSEVPAGFHNRKLILAMF